VDPRRSCNPRTVGWGEARAPASQCNTLLAGVRKLTLAYMLRMRFDLLAQGDLLLNRAVEAASNGDGEFVDFWDVAGVDTLIGQLGEVLQLPALLIGRRAHKILRFVRLEPNGASVVADQP